jgi:uncharacterized repeat protein (TIGR01451 family)
MKLLSRFNRLQKVLASGALVALAIALPMGVAAADLVTLEGAIGVANVTKGDTLYKPSVNATYVQVVKVEVYYHNRENADSNLVAKNVTVKINMPTAAGKTQTISETTKGDNTNTVSESATVNLDRADASLQYIPGSAVWKHNVGTNSNIQIREDKISDAIVTTGQGLKLEDEQPCYNFAATVTVMARVQVPGVKITKQVEKSTDTNKWATTNTANPGDTLKYLISYSNTGNTVQNNVVIRDNLPTKETIVPGTTFLANESHPNGVLVNNDAVTTTGINVGTYNPGANAYVTFQVKLADATALTCGENTFINVGVAHPEGMSEYYNTATTTVTKSCIPTPNTPAYSCDLLNITKGDSRTVTVNKFATTANNGATFKNVVIDWGDQSAALTTNTVVGKTHQYAKDGTYTISAVAHFTVNGADVTAAGANCSQTVTYTTPVTPVTPTTPTTPATLVNTGAGSVLGIFAAAMVVGTVAHRLFTSRRLSRSS